MVAASLMLVGCSTADSKDIRTSGIKADLLVTVKDHDRRAELLATLRAGTLTYVKLGDDEAINVSSSDSSTELRRTKSLGVTTYSGRLEGELRAGTEVTFDLRRDSNNESAPHSTVTLPERLQLIAPAVGTTASRQSPITVRFESGPTDLPTTVSWSGSCIQNGELRLPAGGVVTHIPAGRIKPTAVSPSAGQSADASCTVRIKVFRRATGALDPAYKEGSIVAEAQSFRDITSIP